MLKLKLSAQDKTQIAAAKVEADAIACRPAVEEESLKLKLQLKKPCCRRKQRKPSINL
jgi:hypothetical protein